MSKENRKIDVNFDKSFGNTSEPVGTFFRTPGVGYYIPLYQRHYSWDPDNIKQLMEDLSQGVQSLLEKDDAILFLGTLILLQEKDTAQNIQPQEPRALPRPIDNVIDGQQRISTLALLATMLYLRLKTANENLAKAVRADYNKQEDKGEKTRQEFDQLNRDVENQLSILKEMFSVDLARGKPSRKPIIIRGNDDQWTYEGDDGPNYRSDVSLFLAMVIRAIEEGTEFPSLKGASNVKRNLRGINDGLNDVENAHKRHGDTEFPTAIQILEKLPSNAVWIYARPELEEVLLGQVAGWDRSKERLPFLVQLLTLLNFLVERCCFTVIRPAADSWAFDMFQSLNATGTPLTALETFKPMVNNTVDKEGIGGYKGSKSEQYFKDVDNLFGKVPSANQKNRLTNEFLTTFALVYSGSRLASQFSQQRQWLEREYVECAGFPERENFMHCMSDLVHYRSNVMGFDNTQTAGIELTESVAAENRDLAALCVTYLNKSNHKMANTILSRFYAVLLRASEDERPLRAHDFVAACKAVAAFYTLWRSAKTNSGLDDVYRRLLRVDEGKMSWKGDPAALTVDSLKAWFAKALADNVGDKNSWMQRAKSDLRYDFAEQVCRFSLLVTAHDTIADPAEPGLMKIGQHDTAPYLSLSNWQNPDFRHIEHIAPQNPPANSTWDLALYEDERVQRIGNLTLLPSDINISASNKNWDAKCIYYNHLAEEDPNKIADLAQEANSRGISLNAETIGMLQASKHKLHIRPIVRLGYDGHWNAELVDKRSERICDILWDKLHSWLQ